MALVAERSDFVLRDVIDGITVSPRLASLRKLFFASEPGVASERARIAMEAWKETEGEPLQRRQALKLKKILENVPVVMFPGELLVGSQTKYFRGGNPQPDYDGAVLENLMAEGHITMGGPEVVGLHTQEDWDALVEVGKYFNGKTAAEAVRRTRKSVMGSWYDDLADAGGVQRTEGYPQFVGVPDFARILRIGLRGHIRECEQKIETFRESKSHDTEALEFWQAVIIASEATITLSRRYAALARELAARESGSKRRAELERIAEVCQWVPENPARTFHEALQSQVMLDLALCLESPPSGVSGWGIVDQDWYPYFRKDLDEGRLTLEQAAELIGCSITYNARRERVAEITWRDHLQKGLVQSYAIGGQTRDGKGDASNELSYLILHVAGLLAYAEPHIALRWHAGTPRWLMQKAIEANCRVKGGVPQFQNSEHVVRLLVEAGCSPESARDWVGEGCSLAQPSDMRTSMVPTYFNIALPVDLALHNGVASLTGKQLGPKTGDPAGFTSFEKLFDAFKQQTEHLMRGALWHANLAEKVKSEHWRAPFSSSMHPSTIEKGRDMTRGGLAHYRDWIMKDRAIVAAGDSLSAVKKLVFDERKLSMKELVQALDSDFSGERGEEIRRLCLAAPKYGQEIDEADCLVRDVGKFTAGIIKSAKNIWGYPFAIARDGHSWHFANGKKLAALPSGRKAREPLPDGSLSPMSGIETKGPTAVLNSALKADFSEAANGILNLKFPGFLFKNKGSADRLIDLIEVFFRAGGNYIQFNILDKELLLEAIRHPELHRDLLVRVGGYSAYFVQLSPEIQNEIIQRAEYSF